MTDKTLIVFDAQCLLCSRWIQFLLLHDHKNRFEFVSMQSPMGRQWLFGAGVDADSPDTLLVVEYGKVYRDTLAIFRAIHQLGGIWRLVWVGYLIPAPMRNFAYRIIARNRYEWFGRSERCFMPTEEMKTKFIDL